MPKLYHFFARRLFWLALIGLAVMVLAQLFGRAVWQLELFSHYVPHLAGLLLLASIFDPSYHKSTSQTSPDSLKNVYFLSKIITFAAGASIALCVMPIDTLSFNLNPFSQSNDAVLVSDEPALTIAYQNVNISNPTPNKAITELSKNSPDVLILIEAGGSNWKNELSQLSSDYSTHCGVNDNSPFAMQVFSSARQGAGNQINRQATCTILHLDEFPLARLQLPDGRTIYAAHPPPPINRDLAMARNRYLDELAKLIREERSDEVMVVGDFNLSAFSPIYRDFIEHSQIKHSKRDGELTLQHTTPNGLPTWLPFGIGIDHVLVTKVSSTGAENDINPVKTYPMGWHGSDHRGFWIEWL